MPSPLMAEAPSLAAVAARAESGLPAGATPAPAKVSPATPATLAASESKTSSSEQTFVAVKGASTEAEAATVSTTVPQSPAAPAVASVPQVAPAVTPVPQTNVVQRAAANPRSTVNSIYLFIAAFFALALAVNIFVKIRIQHPNVIMGGLIAISLAGIFIALNQSLFTGVVVK